MKKLFSYLVGLLLILVGLLVQWLGLKRGDQRSLIIGERLETLGNMLAEPDIMP
jgi:hypothetical protein